MLDFLKKVIGPRSRRTAIPEASLPTARARREVAERGLGHSEEEFAQLVAGVRDYAVFLLDRQGNVLTWNTGAERIKGYRASEITGEHFSRFYPAEAVSAGWPAHELEVAAATGRFEDEGWRVRKDGSRFWANVVITALRDREGETRGYLKITRDLTDRKQAEDKLRQSEERFRLLVEGIKDYAIFMLDPGGNIATWNAGAERLEGYRADEIIGLHFSRFYPTEAVQRGWPDEELKRAAAEGRFEDEGWRVRKDGATFWADVVITAMRDEDGTLRGFSKVTRDLTARKEAEEAEKRLIREEAARRAVEEASRDIERQRQQLQVTLSSIGDAVLVTDQDGKVTFMNPVAEKLTGWRTDEAAGRTLDEVFRILNENTRQPVDNPVTRVLREGTVVGLANHTVLISKDGAEIPIDDSGAPIRNEAGNTIGVVLVFRDVTEARRAVEARLRLAAIVESSDDAIIGQTLDGKISTWNKGAERLYGYRAEEIIGRPLSVLVPGDHPDELPAIMERIRRGESIEHFETERVRKDGSRMHMSLTISPVRNAEGKIIGASKIARDITERKRAEAALRQSEAEFRQLADAMPQIVWTAGPDGVVDYSNRRWHEFTGSPIGTGNDGWREILHREDGPSASKLWEQCLSDGRPFEMEMRLLDRHGGGYRWHLIRTVPIKNNAGQVTRWYGTATDIDEQKRSGDSARFLAEASSALATLVDYQSTLQKMVRLAVPYFADWSAADIATEAGAPNRLAVAHQDPKKISLAQELSERYPPDPEARGGIMKVLRTGQPEIVMEVTDEMLVKGARDPEHLRLIRALGLRSYICVPLTVSGQTIGALTFATAESGRTYSQGDLTLAEDLSSRAAVAIQNANLYRALQEEDRRKNEFLALLAHELRNPLAPLRNGLEVLRLAGNEGRSAEEARTMMERQLHQLVRLVDDLLDLSRISQGKIGLRKERMTLRAAVTSAIESSQPLLDEKKDELTINLPEAPVYVNGDKARLAQVVSNLLNNAAKYSNRGSRISLTVSREDGAASIKVKDSGIGIPAHLLPYVFDMFMQGEGSLNQSQGGLGVGLTIVKRLVELHGGSVEAHSEGEGRGSEFIIRLPTVGGPADEPESASGPHISKVAGQRILVVDDNTDAADSLAMMLQMMGNEVRTANDGLAAVEAAGDYRPDVILLDIGMPKLSGYEACRRIRALPWGKAAHIVALTGWGQKNDRARSQQAGFDGHLVKPIEPAALEVLLAELRSKNDRQPGQD